MTNRRNVLKFGVLGTLASSMPTLSLAAIGDQRFELRAQKTPYKLSGDNNQLSDLWLYNGTTPGPEIRVKQGDRVRVHFVNELDEPTSVHWHGIRISNAMDGVSDLTQNPVPPGGTFDYDFVVPDAGTFWYHAHNKSWEQVARGLYGPLIVEEPVPVFDRDHDITLVIDDWRIDNDGALHLASLGAFMDWTHSGRLGNWLTVNGGSQPEFTLNANENYRVRLINASNARVLQIDPRSLGAQVIGYDGFVFEAPQSSSSSIAIAPAQRVDLLIRSKGNASGQIPETGGVSLEELSGREPVRFATFKFHSNENQTTAKPVQLKPNKILTPDLTSATSVPLIMRGGAMGRIGKAIYNGKELKRGDFQRTKQVWTFNNIANLAEEPLFRIKRGQTVLIQSDNQTGWLHGMHVHGHHFQIISRNGQQQDEPLWRDTFLIDRNEKVDIAFVAENPGKWLLHCHMLEHAAAGMQTWFEVI